MLTGNAEFVTFAIISVLEALVIIIGNTFTIFVFWKGRFYLRRTCFLLINLAVADLLVGITQPIMIATEKTPQGISKAFQTAGSSSSVLFLAVISLERVFAVLWPLLHRVMRTRAYIYSIMTVWALGFCAAGMMVSATFHAKQDRVFLTLTISSGLFISLLVICACYLAIRNRLHNTAPRKEGQDRKSTERHIRLSKTFFVVVALSLLFWLPAFVVYTAKEFCPLCISSTVTWIVNVLHLANSMVNPFVYSFRMPMFKDALQRCWRKRQRDIQPRRFSFYPTVLGKRGSFTLQMDEASHTSQSSTYCSKELIPLKTFNTDSRVECIYDVPNMLLLRE